MINKKQKTFNKGQQSNRNNFINKTHIHLMGENTLKCHNFDGLKSLFKVLFLMQLKTSLKYGYLNDIN